MKKIGTILLSLLLVISSLGTFSVAADAVEKPSIGFENVQAQAGETFSLPLYVKKNSGIAGVSVSLKYDTNVLTLKETKKGSLFSGFTPGKNFVWDESENVTTDGILATFTFTVAEQVPAGEYGIQIIVRSCVNIDLDDVACDTINSVVTVTDKQTAVTGISLNKDSLSLSEGASETLIATVTPDNATNKAITWTSSNTSVATVDSNGKVIAVKKGATVITAATEDGSFTASCQVSVSCAHTYVENPAAKYLKSAATSTAKAVYYKSCSECGEKSSETFEYGEKLPSENAPSVIVESKTAKVGSTVLVTVSLQNNPGMWGMDLVVDYDKSQLTLINVTNGTVYSDSEWTPGNLSGNKYILSYEASGFDDVTGNGTLAILEFTINENATIDSFSDISLSYRAGDIINVNFDEIDFVVASGGIHIRNFIYGDLNNDGVVNKKDSLLMKMYLADNATVIDEQAADVYIDGTINKKDSLYLKQYLAGLDVELGQGGL